MSGKPHGGSQQGPAQEDPDPDTHLLSIPAQRGPRSKCLWVPFSKDEWSSVFCHMLVDHSYMFGEMCILCPVSNPVICFVAIVVAL